MTENVSGLSRAQIGVTIIEELLRKQGITLLM